MSSIKKDYIEDSHDDLNKKIDDLNKKIDESLDKILDNLRIYTNQGCGLGERIEKLENIVQKMGVKVDFTSQESGQALRMIAELTKKR